jgi:hypothetical protein
MAIGVEPGSVERAVLSVGNYGEIFERNLGARSHSISNADSTAFGHRVA